jgi:hypothetical protein
MTKEVDYDGNAGACHVHTIQEIAEKGGEREVLDVERIVTEVGRRMLRGHKSE